MSAPTPIPGTRLKRTRLVRTDRYVVAVEVDAIRPEADPSEICYPPTTVDFLHEVESRAQQGDVDWLKQHGKVYTAVEAA